MTDKVKLTYIFTTTNRNCNITRVMGKTNINDSTSLGGYDRDTFESIWDFMWEGDWGFIYIKGQACYHLYYPFPG